ncbi:hypothetical protein Bbelb_064620 [Branchiostoma belcheri]|nr:hypothetical protein Bbelb_064620 [Branchiostoma belcheri]
MRRKLRHLLVFLIIILEKLNTPAAGQSWLVSDKPENSSSNESSPLSPSRPVIGSMFGVVPGTILIITILLTAWYKRRTKEGLNHTVVGTNTNSVMDGGHSQTGQGQSQANNQSLKVGNLSRDEVQTDEVESNTMYVEGPTSKKGHNQTGQGQYQAITESNPNTTAAVVTSDHIPTEQGQSQAITESNTNATTVVVTSDHIRIGQGQYQTITKSSTNITTAVETNGHNQPGQGQSQTIIKSNANTTTTVVTSGHIPTGQGQYPNITKFLDAETKLYGTESTASQLTSPYENQQDRTGQDEYLNETITNDLDAVNMHYATVPTATASELNSLYKNMDTP